MSSPADIVTLRLCRDELERRAAGASPYRWLWRIKADAVGGWLKVMESRGSGGVGDERTPGGESGAVDPAHPLLRVYHLEREPAPPTSVEMAWRRELRAGYERVTQARVRGRAIPEIAR
jgi:hypothetical protein